MADTVEIPGARPGNPRGREGAIATPVDAGLLDQLRMGSKAFSRFVTGMGKTALSLVTAGTPAFYTPTPEEMAARYAAFLGSGWNTPGVPQEPMLVPGSPGRIRDFPAGYNYTYRPRRDEKPFEILRALCENCDAIRRPIEKRKARTLRRSWSVTVPALPGENKRDRAARAAKDPRVQAVTEFLKTPDFQTPWRIWLSKVMEEIIVTDALTLYPIKNAIGGPMELEIWDGATITLRIDQRGRTPKPPLPAYTQIIKGVVYDDFTAEELIYWATKERAAHTYGMSVGEEIYQTINIAIRRSQRQLYEYTVGNTPVGFLQTPPDWSDEQWNTFQLYWDSFQSLPRRSQLQVIPGGVTPIFPLDHKLKDDFDDFIWTVTCDALGLSAQTYKKQMSRASAEQMADSADEDGDEYWDGTIEDLVNYVVIQHMFGFKATDLVFGMDQKIEQDPLKQAQAEDLRVRNGVLSIDEVRVDNLNKDPIGVPNGIVTQDGFMPLTVAIEMADAALELKKNPPPAPVNPFGHPGLPPGQDPPKQISGKAENEDDNLKKFDGALRAYRAERDLLRKAS